MNRQDIDTALHLLNEIVHHVELAVDGGFVPSADLQQCLSEYDALLEECTSVPYIVKVKKTVVNVLPAKFGRRGYQFPQFAFTQRFLIHTWNCVSGTFRKSVL